MALIEKVGYLKTVAVAVVDCNQNVSFIVFMVIYFEVNLTKVIHWHKRNCSCKIYLIERMLVEKFQPESIFPALTCSQKKSSSPAYMGIFEKIPVVPIHHHLFRVVGSRNRDLLKNTHISGMVGKMDLIYLSGGTHCEIWNNIGQRS